MAPLVTTMVHQGNNYDHSNIVAFSFNFDCHSSFCMS